MQRPRIAILCAFKHLLRLPCAVLITAAALTACDQPVEKADAPKLVNGGLALQDPSLAYLAIEAVSIADSGAMYGPIPGRVSLRPEAMASLGAPTAGRVASVLVRPGESVAAGKVLLTLQSADAAGARATLEQAQARAVAAEDNVRRQNEMIAKGVGLELERFEAQTRAREARAELERARRASVLLGGGQGDLVSLRAPTAGVVMTVKATVGTMVAPGGEALIEIADASRLWAVADVPESDTAAVARGQAASVSIPSARRQLEGAVDGLGSRIDPETRRLPIYVALRGDLSGLAPGMYAELRFPARTQAITVPVTAVLIKDGKRRVVYVQRADGRFEPRDVRVGAARAGRVPVLEGLKPGERIVVKGGLLLDSAAEQLL
ncbi:MAG: heavy metal efflux system protein [Betaproteobacteria bacterium]|nr:heavy metal efflux system protein [Betaproteobacteria bacterium]